MKTENRRSPLVILELDGGDPRLITRWAREGYLPTIAAMMRDGCWGTIVSEEQIAEHGTELSLFSGVSRSQHGCHYFRQLKAGTYDLEPFAARQTGVPPFWSYLSGQGKKVAIIDADETYLVRGLPGIQISNWATHLAPFPSLPACAEPEALLNDVHRIFGPQMLIPEFAPSNSLRQDGRACRRFLERTEKKGMLCRFLLAQDDFDLVVVGFFEAHTGGHRFWKYRPELQLTGTPDHSLSHGIRDLYQAIDRQMGLLLAELPGDANVFVVSPYGMEDQYPTTDLIEAFCRRLGYQATARGATSLRDPVGLFRAIVPEGVRVAISRWLPMKLQERLLADRFRGVANWQKTVAFAIPSLYTSFLYVNVHGREPEGIVEPGEDYHLVLDRLEADLKQLIDPVTGRPAIQKITRTAGTFTGDPPDKLPDMFVEWEPGRHFMKSVTHPRAELTQPRPAYFRESYHLLNGFVAAAGPSIRGKGAIGDLSLLDLVPTFLSLMGQPVPREMVGRVVDSIITG